MAADPYATLAAVYEWLIPESLLTPAGSVEAFSDVIAQLGPGARVLDCAAGVGILAVGLRLNGFEVTASDASDAMVERIRGLATEWEVRLETAACSWDQLAGQGWRERFDAVFCVGNSLTHAPGQAARRAALGGMASVLRPGALLTVTSRNWELFQRRGAPFAVSEELVTRGSRQALIAQAWTKATTSASPHHLDIAVSPITAGARASRHSARLACWPFGHDELDADLRSVGLVPTSSTYAAEAERYLMSARLSDADRRDHDRVNDR